MRMAKYPGSEPASDEAGTLSQVLRLIALAIYLFLLFLASRIAFGSWLPPTSGKGLWFYAGLPMLVLGNLVISPFFTKPADAIAYATTGLISALGIGLLFSTKLDSLGFYFGLGVAIYLGFIIVSGIFAIAGKDASSETMKKISSSFYTICDVGGGAKPVFSAVFLFAMIAFHRFNFQEWITIGVAWAIIVGFRPLETFFRLGSRLVTIWRISVSTEIAGEEVAQMHPGIVLIKRNLEVNLKFGELVVVCCADERNHVGVALNNLRLAGESWTKILEVPKEKLTEGIKEEMEKIPNISGKAFKIPGGISFTQKLIGLVATGTDIDKLEFELLRDDQELEEGRLVQVRIGKKPVIYQVINGVTREEVLEQKDKYGYIRASAKKIGVWESDQKGFEHVGWIPRLNEPVYFVRAEEAKPKKEAIGFFPATNYAVSVDINDLITHNCAILGILGIGKTYLALELVERMILAGIKVICLDLTNQYAEGLSLYYDQEYESKRIHELQVAGEVGRRRYSKVQSEGGSLREFRQEVNNDLKMFLMSNKHKLKIYNPSTFNVWKQAGKLFDERKEPPMELLTPTEITRIITEEILELLQDKMTTEARVCLVFEEAHSLIPEWSSVASEGDKAATNGTAKAILQGRKYGLGCLVVTQRTANVTKSILNQCNTVFALRVFDATGMEFLKNYIGEDYAGVLSTLKDRHAVVFGKASSCNDPVLVRLNERTEGFLKILRSPI